ncbi:MAG: DUF2079 domain-containing protein [Bifidobacteriaceae bacterium]|nr:DUF2079 domain-containing protein [Bifidobacteriaceae bacterium]
MTTITVESVGRSPVRRIADLAVPWWRASWPSLAVATAGLGTYLVLTLARWHRQDAPSLDLAIFEQAVKGYAHFGPPTVDLKGPGVNQLGDHFSPVLALLAPFYRLFPSPVTLLVAQCVLVALSIIPVTNAARRFLGTWQGVCLGAAYALSWGLQNGVDVQFHEYAFAVPMLAFALAAALTGHWRSAAWWAAALLTVKEDLGLTVIAFGSVMAVQGWLRHRRQAAAPTVPDTALASPVAQDSGDRAESRHPGSPQMTALKPSESGDPSGPLAECRAGLVLAAIGLAAMVLVFTVIIPALRADGWYYWDKLGASGAPGLGLIVGLLDPPVKLGTLLMVSAVVLGVCWFSPWGLVALPTLAWRFASTDPAHWGTAWHYSMILMPVVFLAAVDALRRWRASRRRWVRALVPTATVASLVFALVATASFPLANLFKPATYRAPERADQAEQVLDAIESGASVASDRGLVTRLATTRTVYWLGDYPEQVQPDYVLIDPLSGWQSDPGAAETYAEAIYGGRYEPVSGIGQPGDPSAYRLARRVP